MTNRWQLGRVVLQLGVLVFAAGAAALAQLPSVRVGIALDGPSERFEADRAIFEREIATVLEGEFDVRFPADKILQADWSAEGIRNIVDRLLSDTDVDLVLTLGVLSSNEVAARSQLSKPVFAPFVINPEIQGIPFEVRERPLVRPGEVEQVRVSGVNNLSYVTAGVDPLNEATQFRRISPFSRLAVLVPDAWRPAAVDLERRLRMQLGSLNLMEIQIVPVTASIDTSVDAIETTVEAVYLTPLPQLTSADFDRLVQALIDRGLPSFSLQGRRKVEKGILAGLGPLDDVVRRARRTGLNIQKVLSGESAAELRVDYRREERLTINMATAGAIGVSPPYTVLIEADLIEEAVTQAARTLSLSGVVREASTVNLDLAVADRRVAAGLDLVRESRAGLLPRVDLSGGATYIDSDRADLIPSIGQGLYTSSLTGSQLIYSDRVWANYGIQRNLQNLREEDRAQLRLDVILEAAEGYLNILRAKTIERVQKQNLELTRSNLQLARARVEIGVAGREEEFRWESQIATNQKDVVDADSLRQQAEIAVNRVLNRPLDERFVTLEATLGDPELTSSFEEIFPYIESPGSFSVFSNFMVEEASAASPELRQLDAVIRAQDRELLAAKRDFYLPDVAVFGEVTGVEGRESSSLFSGLPQTNAWDWIVAVDATLPLFEGGARLARRARAQTELEELTTERQATQQRVEERVRSTLHQTNASFIGIELSRAAADAAGRTWIWLKRSIRRVSLTFWFCSTPKTRLWWQNCGRPTPSSII